MNRCQAPAFHSPAQRTFLHRAHLFLAALVLGLSTAASAQLTTRPFPPNTQRGVLVVVAPPVIQINGKADSLSPGARIRGMNNLLLLSGSLIGQSLVVNFVRNPTGEVHDVWVLTPAEAAMPVVVLPVQP